MALLAYDHTALVEPNLLIPRRPPIGPVVLEESHAHSRGLLLSFLANRAIEPVRDQVSGELLSFSGTWSPLFLNSGGGLAINLPNTGMTPYRLESGTIAHGIGTGDFTWCAMICRNSDTAQTYQGVMANGAFSPAIYVEVSGGNWGGYWGSAINAGEVWPVGTWHHMIATRKGGSMRLYRDGVRKLTSAAWSASSMSNNVFRLGSSSATASDHSDVLIRDIRFYNRAVSDAEAYQISSNPYQNQSPV